MRIDKSTIIISHKISSVKAADHIMVLDQGKICEEGTHENLLQKRGIYSITSFGILYFVVVTISGFLSVVQANIMNKVGQEIMRGLRARVFKIIQYLPLSYLDNISSGRLITRATNDVEALSEMYTNVLINLFKDVFLLIGIVYVMIMLNIKLAMISFCVVPIMFLMVFMLKN